MKMSRTHRDAILKAILKAHADRPTLQPACRDLGVFTRRQWRSDAFAVEEGWMDWRGRETTAGLIAAGVDMDAIHAEALGAALEQLTPKEIRCTEDTGL